jgi:hypothetical protein
MLLNHLAFSQKVLLSHVTSFDSIFLSCVDVFDVCFNEKRYISSMLTIMGILIEFDVGDKTSIYHEYVRVFLRNL